MSDTLCSFCGKDQRQVRNLIKGLVAVGNLSHSKELEFHGSGGEGTIEKTTRRS